MGIDVDLVALGDVSHDDLATAATFMENRLGAARSHPWLERHQFAEEDFGSPGVRIRCLHRLYTEIYSRGQWPRIHEVIVTARAALPGCQLYYGSDSDDMLGREVTDELLAELWQHWLDGPDPHHGYYADSRGSQIGLDE